MQSHSPAWPHDQIEAILPDIFFVTGTNIITHEGVELQHSRNMIIVREGTKLSLINTVRLDVNGLKALDELGSVVNIVRIGAFHDRDDTFYLDCYPKANLWALPGMVHKNNKTADVTLEMGGRMPFPDCSLYVFETAKFPEACLHIDRDGGILITCDSIKNWLAADAYFSNETAHSYAKQGFFGAASISSEFRKATQVQASDYARLQGLAFNHLLSAHGPPIINVAHQQVSESIKRDFKC